MQRSFSNKLLRLGLLPAILACLLSCTGAPREYKAQFYVFGTIVDVTVWGADEKNAGEAFSDISRAFRKMHRDWHAWEPGKLTEINEAFSRSQPVEAPPDIIEMTERAQRIEELSEGRFNPAIGGLIRLWGFHTSDYPILGPPPQEAAIAELLEQRPSSVDIEIEGNVMRSDNPAVQLDFGGIAKGYAIDIACQLLRARGIDNAIVNAGGDLKTIGSHGDRPWRIAIRSPGGGVVGSLEAGTDEAIFTSGNYERFRLDDNERYPHILDPRSGWPVQDLASATVITREGILADAAATAVIVAGLDDWAAVAEALELDQVLIVDENGLVYMTPKMADRIKLLEGIEAQIAQD
jgi:thiamine biosynthesis lipoprotein